MYQLICFKIDITLMIKLIIIKYIYPVYYSVGLFTQDWEFNSWREVQTVAKTWEQAQNAPRATSCSSSSFGS